MEIKDMTTMELNAELFRQLSYIADDESYMKKAVKCLKRLAIQKAVAKEEEYRPKSKAEVMTDLEEVCEQIKLTREGKLKGTPLKEFLNEL